MNTHTTQHQENPVSPITSTQQSQQQENQATYTFAPWFEKALENLSLQHQNEKLNMLQQKTDTTAQNPKRNSLYTTHEIPKPKAQAADSIKKTEEVEMLFQHFLQRKQYRNYAILVTGISTAYRIGDLLNLKYSDFFKADGTFKFEIDLSEEKTSKRRKMEITQPIQEAILLHVNNSKFDFRNEPDLPIFRSSKMKKEAIKKETFHKILKTACEIELKLPYNAGTHLMRKTWAYWYLQLHKGDMSALATLQDILGHSSEKITLRYCGVSKEENIKNNRDVSNLWQGLMDKQGLNEISEE